MIVALDLDIWGVYTPVSLQSSLENSSNALICDNDGSRLSLLYPDVSHEFRRLYNVSKMSILPAQTCTADFLLSLIIVIVIYNPFLVTLLNKELNYSFNLRHFIL